MTAEVITIVTGALFSFLIIILSLVAINKKRILLQNESKKTSDDYRKSLENLLTQKITSESVKSFIYLDEKKLFSISSQLFEGITEYVSSTNAKGINDYSKNLGSIGTGQVLANLLRSEATTEERKFLHDYLYIMFERELLKKNRVTDIRGKLDESISLSTNSFIKVTGTALFKDYNKISRTIKDYNRIMEALTYSELYSKKSLNTKNKNNLFNYMKENNLLLDKDFLESLSTVINFGYSDNFEINVLIGGEPEDGYKFSAFLSKEFLKENEDILIKKYSRITEKEITIFGILTQYKKENKALTEFTNYDKPSDMKKAILNIVYALTGIEETFTGRESNEIIIDPIAVYVEL